MLVLSHVSTFILQKKIVELYFTIPNIIVIDKL